MKRILKASVLLFSTMVVVQFTASAALADQPRASEAKPAVVPSFVRTRERTREPKSAAVPFSARASEAKPAAVPFFRIVPSKDSSGGDREIQALAAELIGRQAEKDRSVPDGRARHFSWIKMPIQGWTGVVRDLATTPEGLRVRVGVHPLIEGGWCAVNQYTHETYLIKGGEARLTTIEYSDPKAPRGLTCN